MSKISVQQFGSVGKVSNLPQNIRLVMSEEITDATTYTITPEAGAMYILFSKEFNASNSNFYGERLVIISAPEVDKYGTTACNHGNAYASSNSGVTIGYPNDSTVTIQRSSATYAVRFAVYRVF